MKKRFNDTKGLSHTMALILGIDAGGTHVDSVIYDSSRQEVLCKAKAFTTRSDYSIGIRQSVERLQFQDLNRVSSVHFTSTISVNSILENKLARTCLILLGEKIQESLPYHNRLVIYSKDYPVINTNAWGDKIDIQSLYGEYIAGSDSVIISDSEGNLPREMSLANFITSVYPAKCICAANRKGNYYQRTLQSLLDAGLRPILSELYGCTERVMRELHVTAPIYVLNNSGKLIPAEKASNAPLECVLAGPAASVAGGKFLTDEDTFLLVDMGGTSADVTKIQNRVARGRTQVILNQEYRLEMESIDIQSFAIGGDSHIHYDQRGNITIDQKKVIPLCVAGFWHPHLLEEMQSYRKPENYELFTAYETDCYIAGMKKLYTSLTNFEKIVVDCVRKKPHSLFWLARHFNTDPDALHMKTLVDEGYLQRISFTPTDLLHVTGEYISWNREMSVCAASIMAETGRMEVDEFIRKSKERIKNNLVLSCMQSVANFEKTSFDFRKNAAASFLIDQYLECGNKFMDVEFSITKPIVALGAPSGAWMRDVASKLGTRLVLPRYYEVGPAIGAAVSTVDGYQNLRCAPEE